MSAGEPLRVQRIAQIESPGTHQPPWLVRSLWPSSAVGILGGPPKASKTWLGLDLAISVASGTPCLDAFPVDNPGRALLYLAEDSVETVRQRIEGICLHRGLDIKTLELYLITETALRLDREADLQKLSTALTQLQPRLLVLDPFVRLHRRDENSSGEVSGILGDLRMLQRTHNLAIVLVHHVRKNGGGAGAQGQALRGSGDLHAWGDCNAYLTRRANHLQLSLEQRFHRAIDPLTVRLASRPDGSATHLEIADRETRAHVGSANTTQQTVFDKLAATPHPVPRTVLRAQLRLNNQRLGTVLRELELMGRVRRTREGWTIKDRPSASPFHSDT